MRNKKITLSEIRSLIRKIIKEEFEHEFHKETEKTYVTKPNREKIIIDFINFIKYFDPKINEDGMILSVTNPRIPQGRIRTKYQNFLDKVPTEEGKISIDDFKIYLESKQTYLFATKFEKQEELKEVEKELKEVEKELKEVEIDIYKCNLIITEKNLPFEKTSPGKK